MSEEIREKRSGRFFACGAKNRSFFVCGSFCAKVKDEIKSHYIHQKQTYNSQRIEHGVAVYKVVQDIVRGAVTGA